MLVPPSARILALGKSWSEQMKYSQKKADVSKDTIHRVNKILKEAEPEVIGKARSGEISINQAYQTVKPAQKQDCSILSTAFSALLNFQECL